MPKYADMTDEEKADHARKIAEGRARAKEAREASAAVPAESNLDTFLATAKDDAWTSSMASDADEPHPDYPGLTKAEVAQAHDRARAKIAKEQKAEALDRITEMAEQTLRDEAGQTVRNMKEIQNLSPVNREMVDITLALPPQMPEIRIDGAIYRDRLTHTVTRAKACEMLRIQFEGWRHEAQRKGDDSYAFYAQMNQSQRPSLVINTSKGIISGVAPRGTH